MGDAEKYRLGGFGDCASAVAACKRIVDDFLRSIGERARSPEAAVREYETFGPEPYIESDDPDCRFSATEYMRQRLGRQPDPPGSSAR